ncbi:TAXI family TRAP transporter solute-binding subunit [Synergistes jonesii]|uniref:TAXI family TRAP transporter solute-binding subunit n=1 Tax=Synergistes jonesii TaxID=2754 RepID=UPI002431ADE3|nr:TAXI family TRAP transporter solute-binding subunit [Synergistes jonesii]
MKKGLFVLALTAMVFSAVGFSAPAQAAQKLDLAICGGSIGGAWAAIGEGVGEVVRRSYPGSNTAYEVGQEAANLALVSRGKIQLGIAHAQLIKMAADGKKPFNKKLDNLRALCVLYKGAVEHFIIKTDTGVNSFAELKDKKYPLKVYFNTKDSFMDLVGKSVIEAEGVKVEDLERWGGFAKNSSMGAALDLMRDGKIDAYSNVIQVPSSHVVDAGTTLKLNLLPISPEAAKKVNADLGTYSTVIPKGSYNFLKKDVPTVGATVVLFTNADLPDDDAYAILKSIKDNFAYFCNIHGSLKGLKLTDLKDTAPVQLHPGAVKFFNENN